MTIENSDANLLEVLTLPDRKNPLSKSKLKLIRKLEYDRSDDFNKAVEIIDGFWHLLTIFKHEKKVYATDIVRYFEIVSLMPYLFKAKWLNVEAVRGIDDISAFQSLFSHTFLLGCGVNKIVCIVHFSRSCIKHYKHVSHLHRNWSLLFYNQISSSCQSIFYKASQVGSQIEKSENELKSDLFFTRITTVMQLQKLGKELNNCLEKYLTNSISGEVVSFRYCAASGEVGVVQFKKNDNGYEITNFLGVNNRMMSPFAQKKLADFIGSQKNITIKPLETNNKMFIYHGDQRLEWEDNYKISSVISWDM